MGCANGELMEELQADGHKVWGVEPDRQALVFAQQRGLDVFYGTAESLPPEVKSRQYDMIVMNHVLEHTRDPLLALRNAMSLLVDGGKLVMEVPNNSCIGLKVIRGGMDASRCTEAFVFLHTAELPRYL
ncbi:class I SAM-dependent methyltransferase [Microcoleus sp. BROC3]